MCYWGSYTQHECHPPYGFLSKRVVCPPNRASPGSVGRDSHLERHHEEVREARPGPIAKEKSHFKA